MFGLPASFGLQGGASAPALSVVGVSTGSATGNYYCNLSLPLPSGAQQDDILIAILCCDNQDAGTTPILYPPGGGWVNTGVTGLSPDGRARGNVYVIRRGTSAPSSGWQYEAANNNMNAGGVVYAVRGVSASLAISSVFEGTTASMQVGDGVGSVTPVSVSAAGANRMLLHAILSAYSGTASAPNNGWTENHDAGAGGTGSYFITADSQYRAASGAVTGRTTRLDATTYHFVAGLAIKPT